MSYNIKNDYAYHVVRAHVEGFKPLTEEQFLAIAQKLLDENCKAELKLMS
jgi:hypothetical protein